MNYCQIDEETKNHLNKLIDFLYHEVLSSGGDGDALWFVRYYKLEDILLLAQEYNDKLKYPWGLSLDDKTILWGENQEAVVITNDEEVYNRSPSWQQIRIRY